MCPQSSRRSFLGWVALGLGLLGVKGASGRPRSRAERSREPWQPPRGATMPARTLGKTGRSVSILGLGGAHIGRQRDPKESVRIIRAAIDHGINFLDNSWDYHGGESERRMGLALEDGYRERVLLMTKVDGRTKQAATAQLEQSLRRLRTDTIDLVQMHEVIRMTDPDRIFGDGGAIEALADAKKAGKLRWIGFTGHKDPQIHLRTIAVADEHGFAFDTVQLPLNVMDPHFRSFQQRVLPVLVERGIGVLGMKPLGDGIILESGVVSAEECLRYAMSLPVSVTITGIDSMEILEQALGIAYSFRPLDDSAMAALLTRTAPVAGSGRYEKFKTSTLFDSTSAHPEWL